MGFLSSLFGGNSAKQEKILEMISRGGIIIDVRTPGEFKMSHVPGSKNIPLNLISSKLKNLQKLNKPIIVCCASGNRSGQAASMLQAKGIEVINGGSWRSLM
ncbi:MAG TPA: rhodanese-like domain-containing protein [Crocinitomix sp.]|nr:rhodanese-like domain-containing protein [Crocinitomix sp.]